MVSFQKFKKGASNLMVGGVAVVLIGAGYIGYTHGMFTSTPTQNVAQGSGSQSFQVYTNGVSNLSMGTLTTSGSGSSTQYTITLHTSDINSTGTLSFDLSTVQDIPAGTSIDKNIVQVHNIKTPFSSDVNLHDPSDVEHVLFSSQDSLVGGQKNLLQQTYAGTTSVSS